MTGEMGTKINKLLKQWPRGTVAVSSWLEKNGVYQQLANQYEKGGWLKKIGHGAYIQAGDQVEWFGGLFAIQNQLQLPIYPGGKTALQILGHTHFLPLGMGQRIMLFSPRGVKLPGWFKQFDWGFRLQFMATRLFDKEAVSLGLTDKKLPNFTIRLSSPERAMMELLYLVPKAESFEESFLLMEGLTTLRPKLVQELLEKCHYVKVKRLFMVLAERANHSWVKKLDLSKVNFGTGDRMLIKGGRMDKKYRISVPELGTMDAKV